MEGFNNTGKLWLDNGAWFPWLEDFRPWWKTYWKEEKQREGHSITHQINDESSLLHYYRQLITLKKNDPVFSQPEKISVYHGTNSVLIFNLRNAQGERWVMTNLDPHNDVGFTLPSLLNSQFLDVLSGEILDWQYEAIFSPGEIRIVTPLVKTQE